MDGMAAGGDWTGLSVCLQVSLGFLWGVQEQEIGGSEVERREETGKQMAVRKRLEFNFYIIVHQRATILTAWPS